ncbi:DUF418 domain-containing protein [Bacillus sp. CGMCC 1.16541]|uniref:DUF418 domain-containing protein n=1 Tax=Bacillus sp. CGMCC 1.16541 TaxID=2185143 RepID=UPI000D72865F|nr:DUF418 domain-containing protein [Bacillus sp. CGMCC 1.16541]
MKKETLQPIRSKNRIEVIDLLRGFALLGILLVNMPAFYSADLYYGDESIAKTALDTYINIVIDVFAQASFYPLFSILFGFGFMMMFEKAYKEDVAFTPIFSRRLIALLFIGCIHAFFIWYGDILIIYAICGFLLLIFQEARSQVLLAWACVLFAVPTVIMSAILFVATLHNQESAIVGLNQELIERSYEIYSNGTINEVISQRAMDWYYVNNASTLPFLILSIFPMFLLGAYIAKDKWFYRSDERIIILKWITLISFFVFILFKGLPYLFGRNLFTDYVQDHIGGPAGAIFYMSSFLLLSKNVIMKNLFRPLAAVGKLSLSNYLLQSLLCTFIFYSYGLGLYGEITVAQGVGIAFGLFILQVVISNMWISLFERGPIERVLRSFTYWSRK